MRKERQLILKAENNKKGISEYKGYVQIFTAGVSWGTIGPFVMCMSRYGSTSLLTSFIRVLFAFFISAVLLNIAPLFTAITAALLFSERITGRRIIALCVNVMGCILAVTGGNFTGIQFSVIGILCGVGAGLCYGMTAIFGRIAGNRCSAYVMSTYSYLFAVIFLVVFAKPWEMASVINGKLLLVGFLYALIPTAMGYLLYYKGVQKIKETSKVPVLASIETVVAAVLGLAVYGEQLGVFNIAGILLVLCSIGMMNGKAIKHMDIKEE